MSSVGDGRRSSSENGRGTSRAAAKRERGRSKKMEKRWKAALQNGSFEIETNPNDRGKYPFFVGEKLIHVMLVAFLGWAALIYMKKPPVNSPPSQRGGIASSGIGGITTSGTGRAVSSSTEFALLKAFAKRISWGTSTTPSPITQASILAKAMLRNETTSLPEELSRLLTGEDGGGGGGGADSFVYNTAGGGYLSEGVNQWGLEKASDYVSERILEEIKVLCEAEAEGEGGGDGEGGDGLPELQIENEGAAAAPHSPPLPRVRCNVNERDPEFGMTPMHLASLAGHQPTIEYLRHLGADEQAVDTVGRAPSNMSYEHFVSNSRKWAKAAGRECEFPQVVIPRQGTEEEIRHALSEVSRLVGEGEPILIRGVIDFIQPHFSTHRSSLLFPDSQRFIDAWGDRPVSVSAVPYGVKFGIANEVMTLKEYVFKFLGGLGERGTEGGEEQQQQQRQQQQQQQQQESPPPVDTKRKRFWNRKRKVADEVRVEAEVEDGDTETDPSYVFEQDSVACEEGYQLTSAFLQKAFPVHGDYPLICPPGTTTMGLDSMHYYLGDRRSGAPFHVHSDAVNLLIEGEKRWWVVPPRQSIFSKQHISAWEREVRQEGVRKDSKQGKNTKGKGKGRGKAKGQTSSSAGRLEPLHCVQRAGDMVYVPFDWGHAAMNTAQRTFGYTMELLNRRDTFMMVSGHNC